MFYAHLCQKMVELSLTLLSLFWKLALAGRQAVCTHTTMGRWEDSSLRILEHTASTFLRPTSWKKAGSRRAAHSAHIYLDSDTVRWPRWNLDRL